MHVQEKNTDGGLGSGGGGAGGLGGGCGGCMNARVQVLATFVSMQPEYSTRFVTTW